MPNALLATVGSPGATTTISLPLYDPRHVREARARYRPDAPPELDLANSFACPSGRWPARGFVLLRRGDYAQIPNLYRTDFQLQFGNFLDPSVAPALAAVVPASVTLKNLAIVQARCVTRGAAADSNAIYLVELTDRRGVLTNPWGQWPTSLTSQYNVVAPAYPGQYYQCTLNSGVAWTWDALVKDLWTQMPLLGSYPGLPSAPLGTPENYSFPGEGCWDAMNHVLDLLAVVVSADLTMAAPYGLKALGAADSAFAAQTAKYAGLLEDDSEYIDSGSGRVPGQVTVLFHRANQYFGTEETVRRDGQQWQCTFAYPVTLSGPAPYSTSQGTAYLWDDFAVRYDVDGNPLGVDVITAGAIAAERVKQFYGRITRGTQGYLRRVYAGALPFAAGNQLDGVLWRQTDGRAAWRTEIARGAQPPWPWLYDPDVR